jgi:hypothetical protein
MITSTRILLMIIAIIAGPMGMALAQGKSAAVEAGAESHSCYLSKDRAVALPSSLSIAQRGYLSELCDKVLRFRNRLLIINPTEDRAEMNSSDFEIAKALYELDSQHVASMSQLIEKAVATEPFPEESFWKAWIDERTMYRQATNPLVHRQAETIIEREQRHHRDLQ